MGAKAIMFVDRVVRNIPELAPIYNEHIQNNDELLPHVFMGDVSRYIIEAIGEPSAKIPLQKLLDELEFEFATHEAETGELISASFLENLIGERDVLALLIPMMGPALRHGARTVLGE